MSDLHNQLEHLTKSITELTKFNAELYKKLSELVVSEAKDDSKAHELLNQKLDKIGSMLHSFLSDEVKEETVKTLSVKSNK